MRGGMWCDGDEGHVQRYQGPSQRGEGTFHRMERLFPVSVAVWDLFLKCKMLKLSCGQPYERSND
jgi:hypothetical protein